MSLSTPWLGELAPNRVDILLRQHIGAHASPLVSVGATVRKGDCIGEIPEGALGARIHASISGKVTAVRDDRICIEAC
jgi:Na+-translocating ferredoxin:NAD+ oxidoreductase RnfC subunit